MGDEDQSDLALGPQDQRPEIRFWQDTPEHRSQIWVHECAGRVLVTLPARLRAFGMQPEKARELARALNDYAELAEARA